MTKVLGIAGSLRAGSFNRALLRAAQELAPDDMDISIFPNEKMVKVPLYNEDVRAKAEPEVIVALKREIESADAILFATPEYNFSIPGVLKNTIDWVSRPPDQSPLNGKPVAIMGASTGNFGTARVQLHLHQICVFTNMLPVNQPQVLVSRAKENFDTDGRLTNETSRKFVRLLLEKLSSWCEQLQ